MSSVAILNRLDRARLADWLAVAVAALLPLSTSATSILVVVWLLVFVPILDLRELRQIVATPAGGLPVLLFLLGAVGMLWADVTWVERWGGLASFSKLLVIPLLLVQFRHSERGPLAFAAYLAVCFAIMLLSNYIYVRPNFWWGQHDFAVPVKNAATQSGEFVTCIFGLLFLVVDCFERRRWPWLLGLLAGACALLFNILFVSTGRTALAIIPVLLLLLAVKRLSTCGAIIVIAGATLVGVIVWFSSPYLRERTVAVWVEVQQYEASDERNSSGERIEFWKKSIGFIRQAPIIGHGTGSIHALFVRSVAGQSGAAGSATTNPHNQTFAVAIQLGLIGAGILWAIWISHLFLFRGSGLAEWIGLVVVVQNIVGSLFNSHLFDFVQGWVYVVGVGVAGGIALKNRAAEKSAGAAT